jgi:hypothetical protein
MSSDPLFAGLKKVRIWTQKMGEKDPHQEKAGQTRHKPLPLTARGKVDNREADRRTNEKTAEREPSGMVRFRSFANGKPEPPEKENTGSDARQEYR